jgi:hypothetical protein
VDLKGYDTPSIAYGATYADLNTFLQAGGKK